MPPCWPQESGFLWQSPDDSETKVLEAILKSQAGAYIVLSKAYFKCTCKMELKVVYMDSKKNFENASIKCILYEFSEDIAPIGCCQIIERGSLFWG